MALFTSGLIVNTFVNATHVDQKYANLTKEDICSNILCHHLTTTYWKISVSSSTHVLRREMMHVNYSICITFRLLTFVSNWMILAQMEHENAINVIVIVIGDHGLWCHGSAHVCRKLCAQYDIDRFRIYMQAFQLARLIFWLSCW